MSKFDFDKVYDRKGTDSFKWDGTKLYYGADDCIGMWTADMDFACAPPIVNNLIERAKYPIYGYTLRSDEFVDSVYSWLKNRHTSKYLKKEWLTFAPPGVIYAIYTMINILTDPGDNILINLPNYDPLFDVIKENKRNLVVSSLVLKNGRYEVDFDHMEKVIKETSPKLYIMSSPHNPTGRVWELDELKKISELCLKYNVYMIVDEIHADFVPKNYKHIPFTSLGEDISKQSMILYSANKGFNLGGLQMSSIVIADDEKRDLFNHQMLIAQTRLDTVFGLVATQTAYSDPECEEWLDAAIDYVEENKNYAKEFIENNIPELKFYPTEGTYLSWIDCSGLGLKGKELEKFMIEKAKVAFCGGYEFGQEGESFVRMTIAVPRPTLVKALNQVASAVKNR